MNGNPKPDPTESEWRSRGGPRRPKEPIFSGPAFPLVIALGLVICHFLFAAASPAGKNVFFTNGALIPQFWMDLDLPITTPISPWFSLLLHGALHGGWGHVIMNATGLVAFGAATAPRLGALRFLLVFVAGIVGGGLFYLGYALLFEGANAAPIIGASGGVSGLLAAASMIEPHGHGRTRLRHFTERTVWATGLVFGLMHIPLALLDEQIIGASIAWQAHIGGYFTGLLVFLLIVPKDPSSPLDLA